MSGLSWYTLYYHGLVSPIVPGLVAIGLVFLWKARFVGNRSFMIAMYVVFLAYFAYMQHVVFVTGLEDGLLSPLPSSLPGTVRIAILALLLAGFMWLGWRWAKAIDKQGQLELSRGWPYLRDGRAKRHEGTGGRHEEVQ